MNIYFFGLKIKFFYVECLNVGKEEKLFLYLKYFVFYMIYLLL